MIDIDDFEELGKKGIVEVTLKADVYKDFCESFYPTEVNKSIKSKITNVVTTSGKIKLNEEK